MTQESKELITKICEERLWEKFENPLSIVDEETIKELKEIELASWKDPNSFLIESLPKDTIETKCVSFAFDDEDESDEYFRKIQNIQIQYEEAFAIGAYKRYSNGNLFQSVRLFGQYVFVCFGREWARNIFDRKYGPLADIDFLTWVNGEDGHSEKWEALEASPTLHEDIFRR